LKHVVLDAPQVVGAWVCARLGCTFDKESATAIGIESDGQLVAGVVYDNYRHRSISMHVASSACNWLTARALRAFFGYPFYQLGVAKVIAPVDSENSKSRRFVEHLGFVLEASIAGASEKGDLLIYTMSRAQCRFLKG